MSLFKNPIEFYAFAIHAIYAIMLASSFDIVRDSVIPFSNIKNYNDDVHVISIVFVYTILISGWIGYTKSISVRPHTNTKLGNLRFVLDLCIVFFTFYTINLTNSSDKYKIYWAHYGELFWSILPILFILYFAWDIVRYLEYKKYTNNDHDENRKNINRMETTLLFLIFVNIQKVMFVWMNSFLNNVSLVYFLFTLISFGIIIAYRKKKWNILPIES